MCKRYGIFNILFSLFTLSTVSSALEGRMPAHVQQTIQDANLNSIPQIQHPQMMDGRKFPRLWVGSIRWEQPIETVQYDVDGSLSPVVDLSYNFQLTTQLRTPDNNIKDMQEGYYVLRMVLLRPPTLAEEQEVEDHPDKSEQILFRRYVAGSERIVQLTQGSIRTVVTFRFHTITATSMRNTLLIQMLPVKANSLQKLPNGLIRTNSSYELTGKPNYMANIIRVAFVPRFNSALVMQPSAVTEKDTNEIEESLDLSLFIRQGEHVANYVKNQLSQPLAPDVVAKRLDLTYMSLESAQIASAFAGLKNNKFLNVSTEEWMAQLERLTQDQPTLNEDLSPLFCRLLSLNMRFVKNQSHLNDNSEQLMRGHHLKACVDRPEQHFSIVQQIHSLDLKQTGKKSRKLNGSISRLSLNSNFATNRILSEDAVTSVHQSFNPIDLFGILRVGYGYSVNSSHSRSKLEGQTLTSGVDLEISQWDMSINIQSYTTCLALVPNKNEKVWSGAQERKGLYLCGKKITQRPLTVKERFYHIYPTSTSSPVLDLLDPKNQVVNMVVRGPRDYYVFLKSIQNHISPLNNSQKNVALELGEAASKFRGSVPALPTVFSYPVAFSGTEIEKRSMRHSSPSWWDRFKHQYTEEFD